MCLFSCFIVFSYFSVPAEFPSPPLSPYWTQALKQLQNFVLERNRIPAMNGLIEEFTLLNGYTKQIELEDYIQSFANTFEECVTKIGQHKRPHYEEMLHHVVSCFIKQLDEKIWHIQDISSMFFPLGQFVHFTDFACWFLFFLVFDDCHCEQDTNFFRLHNLLKQQKNM